MPFAKGQSGNPGGRPKTKLFREALIRALEAAGDDQKKLDVVATALFLKASDGDVPAIRELADRIDGKVPQGIENGEDGAFEIRQVVERHIVRSKNTNG